MKLFKNLAIAGALTFALCSCQPPDPKELHDAVRAGDEAKVKTLVSQNSSLINAQDKAGNTALHHAVAKGNAAMVDFLLANKASVNVRSGVGQTPLDRALSVNQQAIIKSILAHQPDANGQDGLGNTLLHIAAQKGNKEVVEWLLAHKAEVNAKNSFGKTPLVFAVQAKGGAEIAEILIKSGASVNWADENGLTLLHLAATGTQKNLVELLAGKLDVNAKESGGNTPLHYAAEFGHMAVVETLIAHKADVHALNKDKMTPAQYAVRPRQSTTSMGTGGGGDPSPGSPQSPAGGVNAGRPPSVETVANYLKQLEAGGK